MFDETASVGPRRGPEPGRTEHPAASADHPSPAPRHGMACTMTSVIESQDLLTLVLSKADAKELPLLKQVNKAMRDGIHADLQSNQRLVPQRFQR